MTRPFCRNISTVRDAVLTGSKRYFATACAKFASARWKKVWPHAETVRNWKTAGLWERFSQTIPKFWRIWKNKQQSRCGQQRIGKETAFPIWQPPMTETIPGAGAWCGIWGWSISIPMKNSGSLRIFLWCSECISWISTAAKPGFTENTGTPPPFILWRICNKM